MTREEGSSKTRNAALTTAYAYNTRPPHARSKPSMRSGWHAKIDELLERDYCFLGCRYSDEGYLFRGIRRGLDAMLIAGQWQRCDDGYPLCQLERELDVYLVSHELSDALSVARLWEHPSDAAILVFPAALFNARWQRHEAAVLGFAEPGVVFRYPFLVQPLRMSDVAGIVVSSQSRTRYDDLRRRAAERAECPLRNALLGLQSAGMYERIAAVEAGPDHSRASVESRVREQLREWSMTDATPVPSDRYPRPGSCM